MTEYNYSFNFVNDENCNRCPFMWRSDSYESYCEMYRKHWRYNINHWRTREELGQNLPLKKPEWCTVTKVEVTTTEEVEAHGFKKE